MSSSPPQQHIDDDRDMDEDDLANHAFIQSLLSQHLGGFGEEREQVADSNGEENEEGEALVACEKTGTRMTLNRRRWDGVRRDRS